MSDIFYLLNAGNGTYGWGSICAAQQNGTAPSVAAGSSTFDSSTGLTSTSSIMMVAQGSSGTTWTSSPTLPLASASPTGTFACVATSATVVTSTSQAGIIVPGAQITFSGQSSTGYKVLTVTSAHITVSPAYNGTSTPTATALIDPGQFNGNGNGWQTPSLTTSYGSGTWNLAISVSNAPSGSPTGTGRFNVRIFKGSDQYGQNATEITTSPIVTSTFNWATSGTQNVTATWSAPAITLSSQYLFIEVALVGGPSTSGCILTLIQDPTNSVFSAPSGATYKAFAFSAAGGVTMSDNAIIARAIKLSAVGQSTAVDKLYVTRRFIASIVGGATLADALKTTRALNFAAAGGAAFVDPLSVSRRFALAAAGGGALTDAVSVARGLAAAVHGTSLAAPSLAARRAMAAALIGGATLTDAIVFSVLFSMAVSADASFTATPHMVRGMAAAILGGVSLGDSMRIARALITAIAGHATSADALAVEREFATAIHGAAATSGAIVFVRLFALAVAAAATTSEAAAVRRGVALHAAGASSLGDALAMRRALAAVIAGHSATGGALGVRRAFALAVAAAATTSEAIAFSVQLATAITGRAGFAPSLAAARAMALHAGGAAAVSDALIALRRLGLAVHGDAALSFDLVYAVIVAFGLNITSASSLASAISAAGNILISLQVDLRAIDIIISVEADNN